MRESCRTNGPNGNGSVTVDGVSGLLQRRFAVARPDFEQHHEPKSTTNADAGFLATLVNGVVEFTSSDQQISLGSNQDQGNLLSVLQLSNAQLLNSGSGGSITGSGNVGGINPDANFNSGDAAGFVAPVTAGTFTINGVKISVSNSQNLSDILNEINSSTAGVTAVFNAVTGQIQLTNANSGPQSIVLGATGDTSNFLTAAGLTALSGAKTTVGQQSAITVQNPDGTSSTYYNNSNNVANAIPGLSLSISGNTTSPFTLDVTQNTTLAVSTLQAFISTYNAAVNEINTATAPPIVLAIQPGTNATAQSVPGGVLWGNSDVHSVIAEFENIVGGFLGTDSKYNSLAQAGLLFEQHVLDGASDEYRPARRTEQLSRPERDGSGADGTLAPLNVSKFLAAYASNPNAIQNLIVGASSLTQKLGSYLATVTGSPTLLNAGPVGNVPAVSLIQNFENGNNDTITNLQQQVSQITDEANAQATALRSGFVASESAIAGLQAEQQELASVFGFSTTPARARATSPMAIRKNNEQQTYLETSILTAAPEDLIVKIFDVLIIAAQQAHEKLMNERDDIEGIHKALLRAQRACTVLMSSLNMEIGGELSENLLRVYGFWHRELVMANMRKDPTHVERVLGYAREYRETWNTAVSQFKAQKRAAKKASGGDGLTSTFAAVG